MKNNPDLIDSMLKISSASSFSEAWEGLSYGAEKLEIKIGSYAFGLIGNRAPEDPFKTEYEFSDEAVYYFNYNDEYNQAYVEKEFFDCDTTVNWACNNTTPALWSMVDRPITSGLLGGRHKELYHTTRDFGMKTGAIIPLRKSNDPSIGGLVIYTDNDIAESQADRLLQERMQDMKLLAEVFHLYRPINELSKARFKLSSREKECLEYLCLGYGIKQIASRLGTHDRTVQKQIASAKKRLNARTMTQVVVRALMFELINL